jgi:predicted ATPase
MVGKPEVMIERVHVEGFGCIRDQTVDLGPLTVLIGPNDSGKSMLLRALGALAEASSAPNGWQSIFPNAPALKAQTFNGEGDCIKLGIESSGGTELSYQTTVGLMPEPGLLRSEDLTLGTTEISRRRPARRRRRGHRGPLHERARHRTPPRQSGPRRDLGEPG